MDPLQVVPPGPAVVEPEELRAAEELQDRWRRDRQTARVLREYLLARAGREEQA